MSLPRSISKYSFQAYSEPSIYVESAIKNGRAPKYEIPKDILLFYISPQLPKMEKADVRRFFGARLDVLPQGIGVLSQFGVGAPALALYLEMLIAFGAKRFIGVGTAGSLKLEHKINDVILCNKALRDEGTSFHYVPPSDYSYPSEELCKKIRQALAKNDIKYFEEPTWTTDALFRETKEEVAQYRNMGISTVDMEASALFAIAQYRKVQAASLFVVSDLLSADAWHPGFHSTEAQLAALTTALFGAFH